MESPEATKQRKKKNEKTRVFLATIFGSLSGANFNGVPGIILSHKISGILTFFEGCEQARLERTRYTAGMHTAVPYYAGSVCI